MIVSESELSQKIKVRYLSYNFTYLVCVESGDGWPWSQILYLGLLNGSKHKFQKGNPFGFSSYFDNFHFKSAWLQSQAKETWRKSSRTAKWGCETRWSSCQQGGWVHRLRPTDVLRLRPTDLTRSAFETHLFSLAAPGANGFEWHQRDSRLQNHQRCVKCKIRN